MKFIEFMFFSTLENIAFIYFILTMFRFHVRESMLKFIIVAIVLSLVSNSLLTESLQAVSSLLQAVLMICFVAFFLRVHLFNSLIMVITGYVINFIVQWIIIAMAMHFSGSVEIIPASPKAFIVQAASSSIMCLFGLITYHQKGGFSFIDHESRSKRSKIFVRENRPLILLVAFSIVLTFVANVLLYTQHTPYLIISILLFVALTGLIYICVKRDEHGNG
ncbi:MAG: hypothetical protein JWR03_1727 [Cohnella sp.]|nr:hypothetical protein [Cohnella sp.]